jgi:hypothetical protein
MRRLVIELQCDIRSVQKKAQRCERGGLWWRDVVWSAAWRMMCRAGWPVAVIPVSSAVGPSPVELGINPGADRRASECHEVVSWRVSPDRLKLAEPVRRR